MTELRMRKGAGWYPGKGQISTILKRQTAIVMSLLINIQLSSHNKTLSFK
jgi:hypothetical protein